MLNIDLDQKLKLEPGDLIGKMVAVLGITGTGKTNTAAVLIEELFSANLPITIVDIEGEYFGLKTQYEILVAGRSENVDLEVAPDQAGQLAAISVERGVSVVLDVSEFDEPDRLTFLLNYFNSLWEANFKRKRPYAVFVEEAHEFIPQAQAANSELKTLITRLALRGRKRGFSVVVMSQRSAKVAKDVLTQASLLFLHQVVHPADMSVYKELIPLPAKEVEEQVGGLAPGQCLVLYKNKTTQVQVRFRHTLHVGATPELDLPAPVELKRLDGSILAEFKQAVKADAQAAPVTDTTNVQKEVRSLKEKLAEKDVEIERLTKLVSFLQNAQTLKPVEPVKQSIKPLVPTQTQTDNLKASVDKRREAALKTFITKLGKLEKSQIALLVFLYDHEGKYFDIPTVARWLSYAEDFVRPVPLIKLGLLNREKRDGGWYYYKSNFTNYLKEYFQGTDPNAVMATIRRWL